MWISPGFWPSFLHEFQSASGGPGRGRVDSIHSRPIKRSLAKAQTKNGSDGRENGFFTERRRKHKV